MSGKGSGIVSLLGEAAQCVYGRDHELELFPLLCIQLLVPFLHDCQSLPQFLVLLTGLPALPRLQGRHSFLQLHVVVDDLLHLPEVVLPALEHHDLFLEGVVLQLAQLVQLLLQTQKFLPAARGGTGQQKAVDALLPRPRQGIAVLRFQRLEVAHQFGVLPLPQLPSDAGLHQLVLQLVDAVCQTLDPVPQIAQYSFVGGLCIFPLSLQRLVVGAKPIALALELRIAAL